MDLNELYLQHQIALMRADSAGDAGDQHHFATQADSLAAKIGSFQRRSGATAAALALAVAP